MHDVCEIKRQTEHFEIEKDGKESASPGMTESVNRQ